MEVVESLSNGEYGDLLTKIEDAKSIKEMKEVLNLIVGRLYYGTVKVEPSSETNTY